MMLTYILIACALAAVPPLTDEDRAEQAAIIAVGTVISSSSEIIDFKEITTATFLAAAVEKGAAPATISWWVPSGRPEGWVGHQGQSPVPTGTIRIFADELGELLTPNGWEAVEEEAPVVEEPVEEEPVEEEPVQEEPVEEEPPVEEPVEEEPVQEAEEEEEESKEITPNTTPLSPWRAFFRRLSRWGLKVRAFFARRKPAEL